MENKKEKKGGGTIKIVILTIIAMLVVGAAGFFGYNLFLNKKDETKTTVTKAQHQVQPIQHQVVSGQQSTQYPSYLQQVVSTKTFGLDEFLINLADEDSKRYLKVKIFLGYDSKKLDKELEERKPIIRDTVISILRTKKAADITPKNMENIKIEMIQKLNPIFEEGQLNNIYFNDILVQ
ncbi:flagellar basal body-associated protein FliL [Clostridium sp. DJ247]|uniref:flagellar basal body-associated FliL family protein n=1 Tax=Clostridium sp. DJ247 TaxID=2726188 RepID=UPI001628BBC6|nr:flagellar basal body-associated FliL family protein [Clostridium sp. DJ247]MBC2582136.1 flagellar basal body protein FliL [Clostridium sp. DJ247]